MPYEKHEWQTGETITASKLNSLEDGVAEASEAIGDESSGLVKEVADLGAAIEEKADIAYVDSNFVAKNDYAKTETKELTYSDFEDDGDYLRISLVNETASNVCYMLTHNTLADLKNHGSYIAFNFPTRATIVPGTFIAYYGHIMDLISGLSTEISPDQPTSVQFNASALANDGSTFGITLSSFSNTAVFDWVWML